ncbi:MAG: polysaccharide biosynthesis/export family protein [Bacteroidaceae bacterium]|nr:polysaccharide biosynthesis/export family protein [Bacteroidaceae bacterium]
MNHFPHLDRMSAGFLFSMSVLLLSSCKTSKYIYLEDMPTDQFVPISNKMETRIKPGDRLDIVVKCKNQELAVPFNAYSYEVKQSGETVSSGRDATSGYLVDEGGNIDFPILGRLQLGGLTMPQASEYIRGLLTEGKHIPDAVVETRITNFTIYSLGALTPTKLVVPDGHINILQALAQLGDLQGRAKYQKVRVIREDDGQRMEFDIDVTTKDLYESPAFHLQQNDIVYAEPRKRSNQAFSTTSTIISLVAVLASLAYSITYMIRR